MTPPILSKRTAPNAPARHPRARRVAVTRLLAIVALVTLVGACAPSVGALGTPATPPATSVASPDLPSDEPTPADALPSEGPSASESPSASASPSATATVTAPPPTTQAVTPPPATSRPSTAGSPRPPATATPTARPTARPAVTPPPTPAGTTTVRAYFVLGSFTDNSGLVPVLREVPRTTAVATAAMRALLAGPSGRELAGRPAMYSSIPTGTRLLGLTISNGVATVDLSREFNSGGGSASIFARLAQVVYTLTQFPTVSSVLFELDGQPTTVFGGEGVTVDGAVGRADYRDQLPAIFVDRPAWGAVVGHPARLSGVANVFEAVFRVELRDGAGRTIAGQRVTASCGTGCWGTWSASLAYVVAKAQWGTLRVYDLSPKDGAPENVTEYPVWLTAGG